MFQLFCVSKRGPWYICITVRSHQVYGILNHQQLDCFFLKACSGNNKENVKSSHSGHLWGESTGDQWFSSQGGSGVKLISPLCRIHASVNWVSIGSDNSSLPIWHPLSKPMLDYCQFAHLAIAVSPRLEVESSGHAWLDGCNFQRKQLLAPTEYRQRHFVQIIQ